MGCDDRELAPGGRELREWRPCSCELEKYVHIPVVGQQNELQSQLKQVSTADIFTAKWVWSELDIYDLVGANKQRLFVTIMWFYMIRNYDNCKSSTNIKRERSFYVDEVWQHRPNKNRWSHQNRTEAVEVKCSELSKGAFLLLRNFQQEQTFSSKVTRSGFNLLCDGFTSVQWNFPSVQSWLEPEENY